MSSFNIINTQNGSHFLLKVLLYFFLRDIKDASFLSPFLQSQAKPREIIKMRPLLAFAGSVTLAAAHGMVDSVTIDGTKYV